MLDKTLDDARDRHAPRPLRPRRALLLAALLLLAAAALIGPRVRLPARANGALNAGDTSGATTFLPLDQR